MESYYAKQLIHTEDKKNYDHQTNKTHMPSVENRKSVHEHIREEPTTVGGTGSRRETEGERRCEGNPQSQSDHINHARMAERAATTLSRVSHIRLGIKPSK